MNKYIFLRSVVSVSLIFLMSACATTSEVQHLDQQVKASSQALDEKFRLLENEFNIMKQGYDPEYQRVLRSNIRLLKDNMNTANSSAQSAVMHNQRAETEMQRIVNMADELYKYDVKSDVEKKVSAIEQDAKRTINNKFSNFERRINRIESQLNELKYKNDYRYELNSITSDVSRMKSDLNYIKLQLKNRK